MEGHQIGRLEFIQVGWDHEGGRLIAGKIPPGALFWGGGAHRGRMGEGSLWTCRFVTQHEGKFHAPEPVCETLSLIIFAI